MVRAPCCEKVGLKKGRWTKEEDGILTDYIQANGEGSWRSLPKNAGLLRCGKSCRLRWINYLRADLKRGNISHSEEDIIIKLHSTFGNKWSMIASNLPGRTDNEIKNYWNSHLSRKIDTFRRQISYDSIPMGMDLAKLNTNPPKSKGKISRKAMKKNKSSTKKPKEASNKIEVPILPTIPTIIEKEIFSIKDYMVLEDQNGSENKSMNNNLESPNENSMFCPNYDDGTKLSGPSCNEGTCIYDGGLNFNDIMEDQIFVCPSGVELSSCEERQNNDELEVHMNDISEERDNGVISPNTMVSNEEMLESGNLSTNGEVGNSWYYNSNSSMNNNISGIDLDNCGIDSSWNWESVLDDGQEIWNEKMFSWLWENDNWELSDGNKFDEVVDSEKHNAMVAWLLS